MNRTLYNAETICIIHSLSEQAFKKIKSNKEKFLRIFLAISGDFESYCFKEHEENFGFYDIAETLSVFFDEKLEEIKEAIDSQQKILNVVNSLDTVLGGITIEKMFEETFDNYSHLYNSSEKVERIKDDYIKYLISDQDVDYYQNISDVAVKFIRKNFDSFVSDFFKELSNGHD